MALETATYIHQLNPSNPSGADRLKDGDDHIRMLKAALKATFPGFNGPLSNSVTPAFLNGLAERMVPVGTITLYAGASAPTGWHLCDGSTAALSDGSGTIVTPDLRGRAPVGASADHPLGSLFGAESKTVTSDSAGAHGHSASVPGHTHPVSGTVTVSSSSTGASIATGSKTGLAGGGTQVAVGSVTLNDPGHTHGATFAGSAESASAPVTVADATGHSHALTINVAQPSIAVNFIIKV